MHRLLALAALFSLPLLPAAASVAVTTYHNDTYRSGWNSGETTLTAANAGSLQLQQQVALDAQAETQPLLVPGVNPGSAGTHDVVYVATANNTLYGSAISARRWRKARYLARAATMPRRWASPARR
jgi:hypothetical protein